MRLLPSGQTTTTPAAVTPMLAGQAAREFCPLVDDSTGMRQIAA